MSQAQVWRLVTEMRAVSATFSWADISLLWAQQKAASLTIVCLTIAAGSFSD